jgi:hypothetical protein
VFDWRFSFVTFPGTCARGRCVSFVFENGFPVSLGAMAFINPM